MTDDAERRPVGRPVTAPCGTMTAYKRHLRRGEEPCDVCRDAWAAWHRDRYAAKRRGDADG